MRSLFNCSRQKKQGLSFNFASEIRDSHFSDIFVGENAIGEILFPFSLLESEGPIEKERTKSGNLKEYVLFS